MHLYAIIIHQPMYLQWFHGGNGDVYEKPPRLIDHVCSSARCRAVWIQRCGLNPWARWISRETNSRTALFSCFDNLYSSKEWNMIWISDWMVWNNFYSFILRIKNWCLSNISQRLEITNQIWYEDGLETQDHLVWVNVITTSTNDLTIYMMVSKVNYPLLWSMAKQFRLVMVSELF